jgi:hypothetical protein
LHLSSTSPARNVGNNAAVVGTLDLDGNARIYSTTLDMGAYEDQGSGCIGQGVTPACAEFCPSASITAVDSAGWHRMATQVWTGPSWWIAARGSVAPQVALWPNWFPVASAHASIRA